MKKKKGILLAAPAILGFLAFYFIPFLIMGWYSVSFGMGKREFVGAENFAELFRNRMFWLALKNTLRFTAVAVPVVLFGALGLSIRLQRLARGGDWIHTSAAFWILCILYWWKFLGYHILLFFVRLQMIPRPYYEYARLSGAANGTIFRKITWPLMLPTFLFNLLLAVMNVFKCYREAFLLGGNYPDSSVYLLQHFMNNSFQNLNYQKISAVSVSMLAVILSAVLAGYFVWKCSGFKRKE